MPVFKIRLSDFQTDRIQLPERVNLQGLTVGLSAIYFDGLSSSESDRRHRLYRLDRKTHTWEIRDPGLEFRSCFAVGDSLFLGWDGGLARYDWPTSQFTLLASSRRRPAQNQFDDIDAYLKAHKMEQSPHTSPAPRLAKTLTPEEDAESRVIGDMIDPARAEDSFR